MTLAQGPYSQTQHVQIIDSGKSWDWVFHEVAVKKKRFLHIGPTVNISHELPAEESYDGGVERRIHWRPLKRTRWWDQRCFQSLCSRRVFWVDGKWRRRCCGLFRCPEVVLVFISTQIEPRLEAIRPDWLRGSRICRFLYLPSFVDMPPQLIERGLWSVSFRWKGSRLRQGWNQMTPVPSGFAVKISQGPWSDLFVAPESKWTQNYSKICHGI